MPIPTDIAQTWFILQANAVGGGSISKGPFFDESSAILAAKESAAKNPGVPFITVKATNAFATADPVVTKIPFTPVVGSSNP